MADDLREILARLDYCESEIRTIRAAMHEYFPLARELRMIPGPEGTLYQMRVNQPLPVAISARVGTTVHEMRSCLDSLACCLAERHSGDIRQTYFAISKSEEIFAVDGMRKLRNLSQSDKDIIAALKPYRGGHPLLFGFHEYDRKRKHQRLSLTVPSMLNIGIGNAGYVESIRAFGIGEATSDWQTYAIIVADRPVPLALQLNLSFTEPEELKDKNVLDALDGFLSECRRIVGLFS